MGKRRRRSRRKPRQGPGHNEKNRQTRDSKQRSRLLDGGREAHFRYEVEELLLAEGKLPEDMRPFLQQLWTQGSRNGLEEAQAYLDTRREDGFLDADLGKVLNRLLEKYSTWR